MKMEVTKHKFKAYKYFLIRNKLVAHLIHYNDMKSAEENQFFVNAEF